MSPVLFPDSCSPSGRGVVLSCDTFAKQIKDPRCHEYNSGVVVLCVVRIQGDGLALEINLVNLQIEQLALSEPVYECALEHRSQPQADLAGLAGQGLV
jgi:hypothetical protein